jgi:hypothetical protein
MISPSNASSNALVTYTAPAGLPAPPDNNVVLITAQQPGTGGAAAGPMTTQLIAVFVVQNNNELPTGSFAEGGNLVFRLRGFTSTGLAYGIIGRMHLDGAGNITGGNEDVNITQPGNTSVVYTEVPFTGTYNMDSSSHGTMTLTVTSPPWTVAPIPSPAPPSQMTFDFTLDMQALGGSFIEAETGGAYAGSGMLSYQSPLSVFNSTKISGSYVFTIATPVGTGSTSVHKGVIGRLDLVKASTSTTGTIATTSMLDDDTGSPTQTVTSGTYTLDGTTADHGTLRLTTASGTSTSTFYIVNGRHAEVLSADADTPTSNHGVLLGNAIKIELDANGNPLTFDNTSLAGPFVLAALGETPSTGHSSAVLGLISGTAGAAGAGTLAGSVDVNDGGTVPPGPVTLNGATFTIASSGRGTISASLNGATYNFVFYLVGLDQGFLQEQPAGDGTKRARNGEFLLQTANTPIKLPDATFTFAGGSRTDTATSLNSDMVFQVTGTASTASLTSTADTSEESLTPATGLTGAGTVNVSGSASGRGTIASTTGNIAGSANAVVYVDDPSQIRLMGTDSSVLDPQIITLFQ